MRQTSCERTDRWKRDEVQQCKLVTVLMIFKQEKAKTTLTIFTTKLHSCIDLVFNLNQLFSCQGEQIWAHHKMNRYDTAPGDARQ